LIWRFDKMGMYLGYYEYNNKINRIFSRKTVRVFSPDILPMYFWKKIPEYIELHPLIKGKIVNYDLHPLW
jgi:hypothetical protein